MAAKKPQSLSADLQGLNQLAGEGITGITDLVESMHQRVASLGVFLNTPNSDKTTGLTGFIYRRIHQTTQLVTQGVAVAIKSLAPVFPDSYDSPTRRQWLAALNGVMGDHLQATNNPLAMSMTWHHQQQVTTPQQAAELTAQKCGQAVLLIHGLCMNDDLWCRQGHDHGQALKKDLHMTPFYLRYNSGLAVHDNGKQLAAQLQRHCRHLPEDKQLHILCHSMGGLVLRSALHVAEQTGDNWLKKLGKVVFLGTPHQGAVLEKTGHLFDYLLTINPYSAPFAKLTQVRSQGIQNLRHGTITTEHQTQQLPAGVDAYTLAASTTIENKQWHAKWIGDGLVSVDSALGIHHQTERNVRFKQGNKHTFEKVSHMGLLSDQRVYQTVKTIFLKIKMRKSPQGIPGFCENQGKCL